MLGRQSPQGELSVRTISTHHVGEETFHGFLGRHRHRLDLRSRRPELYRPTFGRPSVPPSQLCVALLLQARDGVSDEEAIERTAYDLWWKVALGLEVGLLKRKKLEVAIDSTPVFGRGAVRDTFNLSRTRSPRWCRRW